MELMRVGSARKPDRSAKKGEVLWLGVVKRGKRQVSP